MSHSKESGAAQMVDVGSNEIARMDSAFTLARIANAVNRVSIAGAIFRTGMKSDAPTVSAARLLTIFGLFKSNDRGVRCERAQFPGKLGGKAGHRRARAVRAGP